AVRVPAGRTARGGLVRPGAAPAVHGRADREGADHAGQATGVRAGPAGHRPAHHRTEPGRRTADRLDPLPGEATGPGDEAVRAARRAARPAGTTPADSAPRHAEPDRHARPGAARGAGG